MTKKKMQIQKNNISRRRASDSSPPKSQSFPMGQRPKGRNEIIDGEFSDKELKNYQRPIKVLKLAQINK